MLLESQCSEYGFLAHDTTRVHSTSEQTQGCLVGSCDSSGSGKKGEARSNTKKLMAQSGSWCKVDSCDVHLNICDISLNEKVCHSIPRKSRTFTDIVQDFKFSKGTHVDLRSQSDPPEGSEPRHLSGRFFLRTPTEMSGTSSSGARYLWLSLLLSRATQKWQNRCLSHLKHLRRDLSRKPMRCTHGNRRSRYRDSRSRATSRCATCSSSTVDSTQNLRKTWICSGTRKKRQTSNRVARRR